MARSSKASIAASVNVICSLSSTPSSFCWLPLSVVHAMSDLGVARSEPFLQYCSMAHQAL